MLVLAKTLLLFVLTALAEITGCFLCRGSDKMRMGGGADPT